MPQDDLFVSVLSCLYFLHPLMFHFYHESIDGPQTTVEKDVRQYVDLRAFNVHLHQNFGWSNLKHFTTLITVNTRLVKRSCGHMNEWKTVLR